MDEIIPELKKGPKLLYNYETGEGHIQMRNSFIFNDPLLRMDVIKDWLYLLQTLYEEAQGDKDSH